MAGRRRGTYDAVEQRHAQAEWRTARQRFHQAARRGAVQKQLVADADVIRRDYDRHSVRDESDMANEGFIKNGMDQFAIVAAALRLAADFCSFGGSKVAHSCRLTGASCSRQVPIW